MRFELPEKKKLVFEMTMLGAILSAVVTLIVTARLGRKGPALYDPAVTNGKITKSVAKTGSKVKSENAVAKTEAATPKAASAEVKPVAKLDTKVEAKSDSKVDTKAGTKAEVKTVATK